jgi:hypothetical protein
LFEQKGAVGVGALAEGAVIQPVEQFADGFVEASQLEELPMAQGCYNPALCYLNAGFGFRLGEKRVLQTVLTVAHKFSPSRIHSTH